MEQVPWGDILASGGGTAVAAVAVGFFVWKKLVKIETAMLQLAAKAGFVVDHQGNLMEIHTEGRRKV